MDTRDISMSSNHSTIN